MPRLKPPEWSILFAILFLIPAMVHAGTISMSSSLTMKNVDGRIGLEVLVKNDGNESARTVQIHLELIGEKLDGPRWETMGPSEKNSTIFFFEKMPAMSGTYPVFITIEFADMNMYPFTALNVGAVSVGEKGGQAQLFAKSEPISISKSGALAMSVKNLDDKKKNVTARVLGPREVDVKPILFDLELEPHATVDRTLEVSNFSALSGAGYPIFVIFEYEMGGAHYTHPLVTRVTISQGGLPKTALTALIAGGAFILILAVFFEVIRRVRASSKKKTIAPTAKNASTNSK
jgi:hypothetical protein